MLWTLLIQGHLDAGHIVVTSMLDPALTQLPFDRIMPVIGTHGCLDDVSLRSAVTLLSL